MVNPVVHAAGKQATAHLATAGTGLGWLISPLAQAMKYFMFERSS